MPRIQRIGQQNQNVSVCVCVFAWMDMDITREPDFQLSKAKYKSNIKIRNIL